MKVEELAAYCDHIEREFFRFKGRPGTLSPSDFSRVRQWFEAGLGLNAVLEGIGAAFEDPVPGGVPAGTFFLLKKSRCIVVIPSYSSRALA